MTTETDPWTRTLEELDTLTTELESDGWTTESFHAAHAAPSPPEVGEFDEPGLVFVLPDNVADTVRSRVETGSFDRYEVFRRTANDRVYLVARYLDTDAREAVCFAASYRLRYVRGVAEAAADRGRLHTWFKRIDGTVVAAFEHEQFDSFLPG